MSSIPHPEGVAEVVDLLNRVAALEEEAIKLQPAVDRLREVEGELRTAQGRLPKLLRSMDVEATGNFGWERRMGWFLAEMRRQLLAALAPADKEPIK